MKTIILLPIVILFSATTGSCLFPSENNSENQNEVAMGDEDVEAFEIADKSKKREPGKNENQSSYPASDRIKYYESIDKSFGMPSAWYPVPKSWNATTEEGYTLKGPNNIKISGVFGQSFQFTNNQQMAWTMEQSGQQIVPPMSIDQIVQQFFMPYAQQYNRRLIKKYELPGLAHTVGTFMNQLFVSVPTRRETKSYALEWRDNNGMSYLTTVSILTAHSNPSSSWFFQGQYIEAPNAHFDQAKKDFLYMSENVRMNPKWIAACNQRDARRAGIAYKAHQGRMAAIRARGQASVNIGKIYSEISDINHAGYLKRNDMRDQGHTKSINAINDVAVIGNHNTGEHYNVQAGSKHYWVNNNGEYFGTDNSLYDPRTDNRVNHTEWTQFEAEN